MKANDVSTLMDCIIDMLGHQGVSFDSTTRSTSQVAIK